jgi:hypothetical protein
MADDAADAAYEPEYGAEIFDLCFRRGGQVYWGKCVKSPDESQYIRQGRGIQVWGSQSVNGEPVIVAKYDGYWEDGVMHGSGKLEFYDTSVYNGDFQNGALHGVGQLIWPDGTSYDGCWEKNQMHGQGKFLTKAGEFWEGHFHRNSFLQHSGKWIDLAKEQARLEQMALSEGIVGSETPVYLVPTKDHMLSAIRSCADQNLVPFLIRDTSFSQELTPLDWIRTPEGLEAQCILKMQFLAQMRRRKQNFIGHIYDRLQKGVMAGCTVPLVFDDPGPGAPLPEDWRLENFYDDFSAPREMFNPRLFHGRGCVEFFLPDEAKEKSVFSASALAPPAASKLDGDATIEDSAEKHGTPQFMSPEDRQVAYMLNLHVVALSSIRADIVDDHAFVREELSAKFGAHIPLHRCGIVILTQS